MSQSLLAARPAEYTPETRLAVSSTPIASQVVGARQIVTAGRATRRLLSLALAWLTMDNLRQAWGQELDEFRHMRRVACMQAAATVACALALVRLGMLLA